MNPQDYDHFAASLDEDAGIEIAINSVAVHASFTRANGQFDTDPLPKSTIVLTCAVDLTPEPVQWLWPYWLALGKFHLLAGAPGQGKTTIAMGMAATVTIGGRWPDGSRCEVGNVLIWSGEDDYTDHADAVSLLKAELTADCWTAAKHATKSLKEAGFSQKQVWSASKKIKVVRKKGGMDGGWYWRLSGGSDPALPGEDSKSPEGSQDSPSKKQEPLESSAVDQAANDLVEVEL